MTRPPRVTRFRWFAAAVVLLLGASVLLLGVAWRRDGATRWERPRWDRARFTALRTGPGEPAAVWLVPVNLLCAHCQTSLERVAARRDLAAGPVRVVALVVDTPRRPASPACASLPADEVWWDSGQIWRHRWGHRVYGEIVRFDARGRYLGTTAPGSALASMSTLAGTREAKGGEAR
jgi:hypothetical protein